MKKLFIPLFISLSASAALASDLKSTSAVFSETSLLGIKLSTQDAVKTGKINQKAADCIEAIKIDSIQNEIQSVLAAELTDDEQKSVEKFFESPAGQKYSKIGKLETYSATGHQPPEVIPVLSDKEMAEVEKFGKTSGGKKITMGGVFQSGNAKKILGSKIMGLVESCKKDSE